jgi:hypothetical protein
MAGTPSALPYIVLAQGMRASKCTASFAVEVIVDAQQLARVVREPHADQRYLSQCLACAFRRDICAPCSSRRLIHRGDGIESDVWSGTKTLYRCPYM